MTTPQSLAKTPAERLADRITTAHAQDLISKRRQPSNQPYVYLSGIHTCARNLFYLMTEGEKRPEIDPYVLGLFESGQEQEAWVKRKLLTFGLEMLRAGDEVLIKYNGPVKELRGQLIGKGKIDGEFLLVDELTGPKGVLIPGEVKSMGENMFKRLNTVDDLLDYVHTEKYIRQLLTYMYGRERENGIFVITDCRGHLKPIPVFLHNHLEIAEQALRAMERAWEAKASGQAPERIAFHSKICGKCDFAPICLPETVVGGEVEAIEDPELEGLIARYLELEPAEKEAGELWDEIKDAFKHRPRAVVGQRFEVITKTRKNSRLDKTMIPEEILKAATKTGETRVIEIKDLLAGKGAA